MAFPNGKDTWDWSGDDGANYEARYLMQGYGVGRRTDVNYALDCEKRFKAHCEAHPHLADAWRAQWSAMLAKAKRYGW